MKESIYDIAIVGAGPIGLACAIEAKRNGLSALIVEKGTLVNSLFNYPVNMTFFSTSERLEIRNPQEMRHWSITEGWLFHLI
jgi:thioredoxin reductase (NADPH)